MDTDCSLVQSDAFLRETLRPGFATVAVLLCLLDLPQSTKGFRKERKSKQHHSIGC